MTPPPSPPEGNAPDLSAGWREQRSRLRKDLRRLDVFFFLVCTLVGLDTIGSVAAAGPQGLTWMALLAVVFFLPYGLLVAELGSSFPVQGGPYVWTKLAFGRLTAGVNQVLYWLSNPVWLGGTLRSSPDHLGEVLLRRCRGSGSTSAARSSSGPARWRCCSRPVGKWLPIDRGDRPHHAHRLLPGLGDPLRRPKHGVHPCPRATSSPATSASWGSSRSWSTTTWVRTAEHRRRGDGRPAEGRPSSILRAGVLSVILYGAPILGTLLVLPGTAIGSLGGFVDAVQGGVHRVRRARRRRRLGDADRRGFVMGKIAAIGLIIGVLTSGITWSMGATGLRRWPARTVPGPRSLASSPQRSGTPVRVNILSSILVPLVMVAALPDHQGRRAEVLLGRASG